MRIDILRNSLINEEIDYVMLMSIYSGYSNPRDKISRLIRSGDLIRVKKGLYVFGPGAARKPYSIETLANLIYGPSAISLEYALSWYGLIPEKVEMIQSVTTSRNKFFTTPVGSFSYTHQHPDLFSEGVTIVAQNSTHNVLIATKEKALTDYLLLNKAVPEFLNLTELRDYLVDGLRIDEENFRGLSLGRVCRIEKKSGNRNVSILYELISRYKEKLNA